MSLLDIVLKENYRSDTSKIFDDFYGKCLSNANRFDRAAGYFSSSSLSVLAKTLAVFLYKDGKIRIIANPVLTDADITAIAKGYKARSDVIEQAMLREIDINEQNLTKETLAVISWLIFEKKLDIKVAIPKNINSIYHEKFGLFTDAYNNQIAFTGSSNETISGLSGNFESIDVYFAEHDKSRIKTKSEQFEKLWSNTTDELEVYPFPQAVREKILSHRNSKPKVEKKNFEQLIKVRKYQEEALEAIQINNWQGILEMATGTGKTYTSLLIARKYLEVKKRIFLVIVVPYTHLIDQWVNSCEKFGFVNTICCFGGNHKWTEELSQSLIKYNSKQLTSCIVLTTYKTLASPKFRQVLNNVRGKSMLIADECHNLGTKMFIDQPDLNFEAKVGLSATPDRWWDKSGSDYLTTYFSKVVYQYSMEEAIDNGFLTHYNYQPIVCKLSEEEVTKYQYYTKKLIQEFGKKVRNEEDILKFSRYRALIISKATNKYELLLQAMKCSMAIERVSHTLVYVAPGEVDKVTKMLFELGLSVHNFDQRTDVKERKNILTSFEQGDIQVLIAIKCLDEGVDVPSTRVAYFLASTSNPREFIQRRGRVLRIADNKEQAYIYDFIVLPTGEDEMIFRSIASKELPRFAEFSSLAQNKYSARKKIREQLSAYDLDGLMDKKPWDVYKEMEVLYSEK